MWEKVIVRKPPINHNYFTMRLPVFLTLTATLLGAAPVFAHGVAIEHRRAEAIQIRATYDSGEPMSNAQVVVYAPDNPAEPWLKGTTTEEGTFTFVPESEATSGSWDVRVRESGHGDIISIPVVSESPQQAQATSESAPTPSTTNSSSSWEGGGYTPLQKAIMIALGVWGFVGTALFFSRRSPKSE